MNWLIWRQHRAQVGWTLVLFAAACAAMLWTGQAAHHDLGALHALCTDGGERGSMCPDSGTKHFVDTYNYAIPSFEIGVPALAVVAGALIGAPLVAREFEQRTHLVAWTQSVPRRRWYAAKVLTLSAPLALVGAAAGAVAYRIHQPLKEGGLFTSRWIWFPVIGPAPAAAALLAFALAVAAGAWLKRTLAAVGIALGGSLAVILACGQWLASFRSGRADGGPFWLCEAAYTGILVAVAALALVAGWFGTRARGASRGYVLGGSDSGGGGGASPGGGPSAASSR